MTYKIIGDSCLDLTEDMKKDSRFQMIPLTLQVGSAQVVDDETFDQKRFIEMVKACPECPKTACPSPETFKAAFEEAEAEASHPQLRNSPDFRQGHSHLLILLLHLDYYQVNLQENLLTNSVLSCIRSRQP